MSPKETTFFTELKDFPKFKSSPTLTRRNILQWGFGGAGAYLSSSLILGCRSSQAVAPVKVPPTKNEDFQGLNNVFSPQKILRDFDYGVVKQENGRIVREFEVFARSTTVQLNAAISYISWNLNNRIPGPTFRATEGDRLRIIFHNQDGSSHSLHFHGTHPMEMDGMKAIRRGQTMVYEFDAEPYGVHPYHCHVAPVARHVSKGLYGMLIIDPPEGRPPADEMILVMGGYDLEDKQNNSLYAFNGIPNYYRDRPITIYQDQLIRLYLLNMVEFDPVLTFHIHANMFQIYPTGRGLKPREESDVITMGTAERHILEFSYKYLGKYMFHPHQDEIADNGCMGFFEVIPS